MTVTNDTGSLKTPGIVCGADDNHHNGCHR
jgi:hypothetical protein